MYKNLIYDRIIFKSVTQLTLLLAFIEWFVLQIKIVYWGDYILGRYVRDPTRLTCVEISVVIVMYLNIQK
jgi:hypothetical protein